MDILKLIAMAEANRGKELMVFDWDKAAKRIVEARPESASAGLIGDWKWAGGEIYLNGNPVRTEYTYLASTWATPGLEMDGKVEPCYRMKSEVPDWDSDTKWPDSALKILFSGKEI